MLVHRGWSSAAAPSTPTGLGHLGCRRRRAGADPSLLEKLTEPIFTLVGEGPMLKRWQKLSHCCQVFTVSSYPIHADSTPANPGHGMLNFRAYANGHSHIQCGSC